jgi:signal transduction histidine kinase
MSLTSIGTRISAAFIIVLLAFAIFAVMAFREISSSSETEKKVTKSHEVISQIVQLNAATTNVQSAVRGYTLTGDESLTESVEWNRIDLVQSLEELRSLSADNTELRGNVSRLGPLVDKFISFYTHQLDLRKTEGMEAAVAWAKTQEGQLTWDAILTNLDEMKDAEERLLETRITQARESVITTQRNLTVSAAITIAFGFAASIFITHRIVTPIARLVEGTERIGSGDFDHRVATTGADEIGQLGSAFNEMVTRLQASHRTVAEQDWLKGCLVRIGSQLQGQRDIKEASRIVLAELADALDAKLSGLYLRSVDASGVSLNLRGCYGCAENPSMPLSIRPGDGLVGQCYIERRRIVISHLPPDYLKIGSALGGSDPRFIVLQPAIFEGEVEAILELASFQNFSSVHYALLDQLGESLAVAFHTIQSSQRTEELLKESQTLATRLEENARQLGLRNKDIEHKNDELEDARLALQERAEQLSRSNEDLEQFAYVASHDLQEPLRAVAGFASLLERKLRANLDEQSQEHFKHITDGANRMKALIADLLTYSRLNRRESFQVVDTEQVFAVVLQNLEAAISTSNAIITHDPLPTLMAEKMQMGQLLQNLLSNAIKFASNDTPTVHVGANQLHDGSWQFSVHDNGIGIAPEFVNRIFTIFQRLHTREQYPGTGIGLAICKKIAELHHGRIWVKSELGKGSTFFFTIAFKSAENLNIEINP